MKRYFIKSLFYGWKEVDKERFDRFSKHLHDDSNPPRMTREEVVATRTKVVDAETAE